MVDRKEIDGESLFDSLDTSAFEPATDDALRVRTPSDETTQAIQTTQDIIDVSKLGQKVRATLKAELGDDVYSSWFNALEFQTFDGRTLVKHNCNFFKLRDDRFEEVFVYMSGDNSLG